MAEKKPTSKRGRPRKHTGEPDSQGRSGVPLSIRLDPLLRSKVTEFQALFKRQHDVKLEITDVVEKALIRLFREHKLLPEEGDPS